MTCEEKLQLARKLNTAEGFVDEYQNRLYDYTRNIDAYYSVENDYFDLFGRNRYSCYQSFHTILRRIIKRNRTR
mgnify:FL=1|tara:strand:- start:1978 stop:2199 length:222 start_codon:yes stop_codon:yes gene_type:complete